MLIQRLGSIAILRSDWKNATLNGKTKREVKRRKKLIKTIKRIFKKLKKIFQKKTQRKEVIEIQM
jgi:hypothetical protein